MQRLLLAIIVLLAALLLARDPRLARGDEVFLGWLLRNSIPNGPPVPLTVVEIAPVDAGNLESNATSARGISPLEFALFLQTALEFKPTVLAIEPIVRWRERDKDQEQIFLDQAMRVPKLLLAAELTSAPDPDVAPLDMVGFPNVHGRRGDLPVFSGIARQPDEDLRLVANLCFNNVPAEFSDGIHVPLLFQYRGEIIPAFALQAYLTWARISAREVQIELGSYIALPQGRRIPIASDGSLLLNPNASSLGHRLSLNELLVLAQQRPKGSVLETLPNDLVLARTPLNPLSPPDVFASAIATLQSGHFVRRVGVWFDCAVLLLIALLAWFALRLRWLDVILGAIAFTTAYCLAGIGLISQYQLWLPGLVPLAVVWLSTGLVLLWPRSAPVKG